MKKNIVIWLQSAVTNKKERGQLFVLNTQNTTTKWWMLLLFD
jgi:predicted 2-oxoglutarate/Fe(II)-dependent dioxygenase YbiX